MKDTVVRKRVLFVEVAGFLAAIVLLWINELLDLPHRLFATGPTPVNWAESVLESVVLAALGLLTVAWSAALFRKVRHLEGFLPVCRICKRIRVGEEWVPVGDFVVQQTSQTGPMTGTCPDCTAKLDAVAAKLRGERSDPRP